MPNGVDLLPENPKEGDRVFRRIQRSGFENHVASDTMYRASSDIIDSAANGLDSEALDALAEIDIDRIGVVLGTE